MKKVINKKHRGSGSILVVLIVLAIISGLMIGNGLNIMIVENQAVQDALQFSQIACYSKIDKKILGNDQEYTVFSNPNDVLNLFKDKLIKNLDLNSDLTVKNSSTISGKINIKEFIIYNVKGNTIEIYKLNGDSTFTKSVKDKASGVKTPNNYVIETTTIHTTLMYDIKFLNYEKEDNEATLDTDIVKD